MTSSREPDRSATVPGSPALSIVVPNYNHAEYLPRCLNALVNQSVLPLEILIMDDASKDNSVEVAEDFVRRYPFVRLHRNGQNRGVIPNLNLGLSMIRGNYVLFAAADDEVLPGFIEKSLAILRQHPLAAFSCTIGDWVELGTGLNWHVGVAMGDQPCYISPDRMAELERQGKIFIASSSTIFRKDAFLELGGYNPEFRWQTDWFAFTVAGFRHGFCFVPEPLARAYIYPTSYFSAGHKTAAHRQSLESILDTLMSPQYQDVEPKIRDSGALYIFGAPILRIFLSKPRYRRFLTPVFLRKNLWHTFKVKAKKFTPAFIGNLYFKMSGYRARTKTPASGVAA